MQKVKKNHVLRLMSIVLLFTLVSTCLLGGTLAKYVSEVSGTATARVAEWGFTGMENSVDVFKTAYAGTLGTSSTVAASNGDLLVAPGTTGAFGFTFLSGKSEVATKITFAVTETNTGDIPIVYQYGSDYYSNKFAKGNAYLKEPNGSTFTTVTIAGDLDDMAIAMAGTYAIVPPNVDYNTLATGSIKWFWAFEQDATDNTGSDISGRDAADTALGRKSPADTVTLIVKLTATQVD